MPTTDDQSGSISRLNLKVEALSIELATKSEELKDSLEHQSALAEVLTIISQSPNDVRPVLDAIAKIACHLCQADHASIFRVRDGACHLEASQADPEFVEHLRNHPLPLDANLLTTRVAREQRVLHIVDAEASSEFDLSLVVRSKSRTLFAVPLQHEGAAIGVITIGRYAALPFAENQINLVKTFADQAVIAIENARLFAELQEQKRLVEQQSAELAEWNRTLESRVNEQVDQLGRMSKLTRFLSPKISDLIMSGEADDPLKTRRSEVTVVYVDLRGFTAFTETADPEEVMSVLREYHAELGRGITAHDGTIEHFAGDGAMILFNAPMPMENHELKAIHMTLQLRDAVGALAEGWRKRGFVLGFGAGIAGGYATIGTIGFEERLDYSAIGNVCNLAARLCGEATNGQILISPRVFVKVEDIVEADPMGEMELKGFHRPVAVHNVISLRCSNGPHSL